MTSKKKSPDLHYCDKCNKDYRIKREEPNLEGLDDVQKLIAKDKTPAVDLACPNCGTYGYPYFLLDRKTNIFENVSSSAMLGWLLLSYYINGKWIHPLLIYLFDLYEHQSDILTWIFISPFFTLGLFGLIAKLTSKNVMDKNEL
jgi:hypothetical protein